MSQIKYIFCTAAGVFGGLIANICGGWTIDMATLLIFMGIDIITGLAVASVFKRSEKTEKGTLSSHAMARGLCRKGAYLLIIIVAYRLDLMLGANYIRTATIIGFIVNEGISIIENVGLMGVPLPSVITKSIDVLKDKIKEEDEEE